MKRRDRYIASELAAAGTMSFSAPMLLAMLFWHVSIPPVHLETSHDSIVQDKFRQQISYKLLAKSQTDEYRSLPTSISPSLTIATPISYPTVHDPPSESR